MGGRITLEESSSFFVDFDFRLDTFLVGESLGMVESLSGSVEDVYYFLISMKAYILCLEKSLALMQAEKW